MVMGAPWGELTWGGKYPGRLPASMRGAAAVSALLLAAFALIVSVRAGLLLPQWAAPSRIAIWFVVAYCAVGVLANAATPSRKERLLWLPVVAVLLACSLLIALR